MKALSSPMSNSFQLHPLLALCSLLCLLVYCKIVAYIFSKKNNSKASISVWAVTFGPTFLPKTLAPRVRENGGDTEFHFLPDLAVCTSPLGNLTGVSPSNSLEEVFLLSLPSASSPDGTFSFDIAVPCL